MDSDVPGLKSVVRCSESSVVPFPEFRVLDVDFGVPGPKSGVSSPPESPLRSFKCGPDLRCLASQDWSPKYRVRSPSPEFQDTVPYSTYTYVSSIR